MVSPPDAGGDPDSFPSTEPFDFNSATYFIPMCSLLGVAIASLVIGGISDRIGRKPCILLCLYGSIAGQIIRWLLKFNFWAFCAASFANGLVSATLPVGLAYIVLVAVLYVGFPFTVLSQLSTGPMLDVIAPPEKRGSIQGLNSMSMNFAGAVAPWVMGLFADGVSATAAIATCIGISFVAALINVPLLWKKGLGAPPKKVSADSKPLKFEDKELVDLILKGNGSHRLRSMN